MQVNFKFVKRHGAKPLIIYLTAFDNLTDWYENCSKTYIGWYKNIVLMRCNTNMTQAAKRI